MNNMRPKIILIDTNYPFKLPKTTIESLRNSLVIENERRISSGESPIGTPGVKEKCKKIRRILGTLAYFDIKIEF